MNNNDGMAHQHGGQHLDGAVGSFGSQGQQHQQLLMPQDGVQGGSQQSQGASQQDILTQQLHQVLIADTGRFWTTTVAPSTQAIAQCTNQLQKEAADLTNRADTELQGLVDELTRVHGLVASFQDQIRETLSMLQG